MPSIEASGQSGHKGREQVVFDPPFEAPSDWELDENGRPVWISRVVPPDARWAILGPFELPALHEHPTDYRRFGRPRNRETRAELLREIAWAHACGDSYRDMTRRLGEDAKRWRTIRGWSRQARELVHDEGVLPWTVFDHGDLPDRWWEDRRFLDALSRWQAQAFVAWRQRVIYTPLREAASGPRRALESVYRTVYRNAPFRA